MFPKADGALVGVLREHARPLTDTPQDYDPLLEMIGDARFVLIGDGTHGTHEFYHERAEITKRLIREKGFNVVAVEADWPDAYRINRFVRNAPDADHTALDSLEGFKRFPTWMWRNLDVLEFITWLRLHNELHRAQAEQVGFYGLDLYSLNKSIEEVLTYLDRIDPDAAARARYRYSCFDHYGEDTQAYGYAATFGMTDSCQNDVVNQLVEIQRNAGSYLSRDGHVAEDEQFFAEQNARLVMNAENYYRSMFEGRVSSWNLRDSHMAETLKSLVEHFDRTGRRAKVVIWEHNSHLGDARASDMGRIGEHNVGQLVRQQYGSDALLIGFTTYTGTVTAAYNWDQPPERKRVRRALPESYEALFHEVGIGRFSLNIRDQPAIKDALSAPRLERAIGVIYRPDSERVSHYFSTRLAQQFDAVVHIDETQAIEPLERNAVWERGEEPPETYPAGV